MGERRAGGGSGGGASGLGGDAYGWAGAPAPSAVPLSPDFASGGAAGESGDSAFNKFNFWRNSYDLSLVPDDV